MFNAKDASHSLSLSLCLPCPASGFLNLALAQCRLILPLLNLNNRTARGDDPNGRAQFRRVCVQRIYAVL